MIGQLRGGIMPWIGIVEAVQVRALDGLVLTKLQQSLRYGEPLSLPTDSARVFPLWQLLGHSHHPHFRSVFVFRVLKRKTRLKGESALSKSIISLGTTSRLYRT